MYIHVMYMVNGSVYVNPRYHVGQDVYTCMCCTALMRHNQAETVLVCSCTLFGTTVPQIHVQPNTLEYTNKCKYTYMY